MTSIIIIWTLLIDSQLSSLASFTNTRVKKSIRWTQLRVRIWMWNRVPFCSNLMKHGLVQAQLQIIRFDYVIFNLAFWFGPIPPTNDNWHIISCMIESFSILCVVKSWIGFGIISALSLVASDQWDEVKHRKHTHISDRVKLERTKLYSNHVVGQVRDCCRIYKRLR